MWQGIWFALASGLLLAALAPAAGVVFEAAGHAPALRADETTFARVLLLGAFPIVLMPTLAGFFSGRGATRVVLLVSVIVALANVLLDYLWIFGRLGFPEGGVAGAALATVVANVVGAGLLIALMLRRRFRAEFATLRGWRLEPRLFVRLLRFGLPAGSHFPLELLAVALFTLIVGRLGTNELAATGIAFSLNGLVFAAPPPPRPVRGGCRSPAVRPRRRERCRPPAFHRGVLDLRHDERDLRSRAAGRR